jgi:hypothetical protein
MTRLTVVIFMLALILAGPVNGSVRMGDTTIEFMGGWATAGAEDPGSGEAFLAGATGDDYDGWLISGALGHFLSDNLQIAVTGFGAWLKADGVTASLPLVEGFSGFNQVYDVDVDTTIYGIGGRFRWHFAPAGRLVPYIGAQVFWASADVDISGRAAVVSDEGEVVPGLDVTISESDSASGILWGPVAGLRWQVSERDDLLVEYQYHLWGGDIGDILEDGHAVFIGISHQFK